MDDFSVDMFFIVRTPAGDEVKRYSGAVLNDDTISMIIDDIAENLNGEEQSDD